MLKKVDTIKDKNIDENQLMAEKIVDIINGYGVENCGLRISNGVILVSTINKYKGLATISSDIKTLREEVTAIKQKLNNSVATNDEAKKYLGV